MHARLLLAFILTLASAAAQTCPPHQKTGPTIKAPIRNVTFSDDTLLLVNKEQEIADQVFDHTVDPKRIEPEVASIAEEAAERTRVALRDEGYFKAEVTAKAVRLNAVPPQYTISVLIRRAGQQFRLGELNFVKAPYFPTQQLLDLFPIQRGEIFDREKIAGAWKIFAAFMARKDLSTSRPSQKLNSTTRTAQST